jgi:hypothetical protein
MRLETGGNFVRDFSSALGKTRIAVVLVSAAALERMTAERLDPARDVRTPPPLALELHRECFDESICASSAQPHIWQRQRAGKGPTGLILFGFCAQEMRIWIIPAAQSSGSLAADSVAPLSVIRAQ